MRLKFLFFPIILVISVTIFISYIWPEIGSVKKINEDKIAKNGELQAIKEKQSAIELIGKKISDNADGEDILSNYLPQNKIEERIISGVNYLAGDANVSLVNISLSSAKDAAALTSAAAPDPSTSLAPVGAAVAAVLPVDPITGQPIPSSTSPVQTTSAKISLIGDYAKIRIFLDSLQRMPIFNTIKSVDITKQKSDNKDAGTSDSALSVDINVDFGYMDVAKVDSQRIENFNAGLDSQTIDSLKKYISQKSQSIGSDSDAKGKANPFLVN